MAEAKDEAGGRVLESPVRTSLPEYAIWKYMRRRCHNPKNKSYEQYGGRGISVCPEWLKSFDAFFAHVGPRPSPGHSIDRIDNDRGYEPGNVRWATASDQQRNRRNVRRVMYGGIEWRVPDLADHLGIDRRALSHRIERGCPENKLSMPIAPHAKLSSEALRDAQLRLSRGQTLASIAKVHNVHPSAIGHALRRQKRKLAT